jgi:hypothetical protein
MRGAAGRKNCNYKNDNKSERGEFSHCVSFRGLDQLDFGLLNKNYKIKSFLNIRNVPPSFFSNILFHMNAAFRPESSHKTLKMADRTLFVRHECFTFEKVCALDILILQSDHDNNTPPNRRKLGKSA